jgi:hypothetical protein
MGTQLSTNHVYIWHEIKIQEERYDKLISVFKEVKSEWINLKGDFEIDRKLSSYSMEIQGLKYSMALNISAYVESMANFYLATNMEESQFNAIERCTLEDKWMQLIPMIESKFLFPKGTHVDEAFKTLKQSRNAITHMKPSIKVDGIGKHKGLNPDGISLNQEDERIIKLWIQLPNDLLNSMETQIGEDKVRLLKHFSGANLLAGIESLRAVQFNNAPIG